LSKLSDEFASGKFHVTCELNPPKGVNLDPLYQKAEFLKGVVSAFNLTDSAGSSMTMAPIAVASLLSDRGVDTILQITGRDRNKMALQSELLAASALGVTHVLCMSGDPPGVGDHPDATAVGDLDAIGLLDAVKTLGSGKDLAGNDLKGSPALCAGAVANPGTSDLTNEIKRMEAKVEAGAAFFQTQAFYDPQILENFMKEAGSFGVPILAGLIVLKSSKMATYLNDNLPGVTVPDQIVEEMDNAEDNKAKSVEVSARIVRWARDMCDGVHIMAMGWESQVPEILRVAEID
jgi:5,10-methylenetetrahydrofolate reductase